MSLLTQKSEIACFCSSAPRVAHATTRGNHFGFFFFYSGRSPPYQGSPAVTSSVFLSGDPCLCGNLVVLTREGHVWEGIWSRAPLGLTGAMGPYICEAWGRFATQIATAKGYVHLVFAHRDRPCSR